MRTVPIDTQGKDMARRARTNSESGYLHLITRGIGKQILFESRDDYVYYLSLLKRFSKETDIAICAYCLMENHVHLLVHDKSQNVSLFMKKIGVSYSRYYNLKYERSGHLFQDRYISEPIEYENYLVTVFRYILTNPVKAGICPADLYEWSSYKLYESTNSFVDASELRKLIGDKDEYAAYIAAKNEDECLEYEPKRHDDQWAIAVIRESLHINSGTTIQTFDKERRDEALRLLKEKKLTIRQIERLTGINRGLIQKA